MTPPDFRPIIQARMEELSMTTHALARLCGWTPSGGGSPTPTTIRDYLNGRQQMRADGLAKVCGALGLELSQKLQPPPLTIR